MIELDRLSKRFGSVTALDDLSFNVRPGHVTGFLGPNGAGKTTTMKIILGLDTPTAGTALVNGRRYDRLVRPLHQVGSLLDATALHGGRTARLHLASIAQSNGIGRRRVAEVLTLTGMEAVADRRVNGYSLGMKQRLGLAAALLGDPPVLMLDEPVNGLDTEGIGWIRQFFKVLAAEGRTVLVSSHLMSEMALSADHLIIIGRGKLLADMPTAQLIAENAPTTCCCDRRVPPTSRGCSPTAARPSPRSRTAPSSSPAWTRTRSATWPRATASPCTRWCRGRLPSRTPTWTSPAKASTTTAPPCQHRGPAPKGHQTR